MTFHTISVHSFHSPFNHIIPPKVCLPHNNSCSSTSLFVKKNALRKASFQDRRATQTCFLLPTWAMGLSDSVCVCCEAPFYCACQGQDRERYVRNSHVSYPHSSIGAAILLPIETQKANFYLSADAGWLFLPHIVRQSQRQGDRSS